MAKLAKEATTIRRVLESLFRYFDNGNLWSLNHGLALSVLKDIQFLMDSSGINFFLREIWYLISKFVCIILRSYAAVQTTNAVDLIFHRFFF